MRHVLVAAAGAALVLAGCRDEQSASTASGSGKTDLQGAAQVQDGAAGAAATRDSGSLPKTKGGPGLADPVGDAEVVATFDGPMPTGVTVSREGRVFVNFPRWGDPVEYTVAELKGGRAVAYPDEKTSVFDPADPAGTLVSVQSVVVDPSDRLWALDTGSVRMGPTIPDGPKLVAIDLRTNKVTKSIKFPPDVALPSTYLNDVRFDLRRGTGGYAFITDSSAIGPNGVIVVDLNTGRSWRRLNDHPSTKARTGFVPTVEGQPLMVRRPGEPPAPMKIGSDGIAISPDGSRLFYCALADRKLYSVGVDALIDEKQDDAAVAATVEDHGSRGFASDGLESDASGNLYLTDYENNAVRRRSADGKYEVILRNPQMIWPDTLSVGADGYLYVMTNQLNRQKQFHGGKDLREKPYVLFRAKIDAQPVRLAK